MQKLLKRFKVILCLLIVYLIILIVFQKSHSDVTAPVIKFDSDEITVSVKDDNTKLLSGVTASDDIDGDVTNTLFVESISDLSEDGSRIITYAAYDSSDNIALATRTLNYSDYKSPRFKLEKSLTFSSGDYNMDIASSIIATDVLDGDISPFVKLVDSDITIGQVGKYSATVAVYNSAGDSSTLKIPVFIDTPRSNAPSIELTDYLVYKKKGSDKPDWRKYIDSVKASPNDSSSYDASDVKIDASNVKLDKSGSYYVTYQLTSADNVVGYERLVVIVK